MVMISSHLDGDEPYPSARRRYPDLIAAAKIGMFSVIRSTTPSQCCLEEDGIDLGRLDTRPDRRSVSDPSGDARGLRDRQLVRSGTEPLMCCSTVTDVHELCGGPRTGEPYVHAALNFAGPDETCRADSRVGDR